MYRCKEPGETWPGLYSFSVTELYKCTDENENQKMHFIFYFNKEFRKNALVVPDWGSSRCRQEDAPGNGGGRKRAEQRLRLETGHWRLETGHWRLETGHWWSHWSHRQHWDNCWCPGPRCHSLPPEHWPAVLAPRWIFIRKYWHYEQKLAENWISQDPNAGILQLLLLYTPIFI